jgi:two-component system sensor histidine kinase KdpD
MFLVALVISHLTILMRQQAQAARLQERQTAAMYSLSQQLAHSRGVENILQVAVRQIWEIFESQVVALLPDEKGKLYPAAGDFFAVFQKDTEKELSVALWAYRSGQMGGWGTKISPDSPVLYVPLQVPSAVIGVLALRLKDSETDLWLLPEQLRLRLLESLAKQVALALEVDRLEKTAVTKITVADT